jgi:hypothetical protein
MVARTGDIQELLIEHVTSMKKMSTEAAGNWKIVPAEAVAAMERAADASAASQTK